MCLLHITLPAVRGPRQRARPLSGGLPRVGVAGLLAALLMSAAAAHAGQCAQEPVANAPAFVDDRPDLTVDSWQRPAALPPVAATVDDGTPTPTAPDTMVATVGRPTGPEVQPCRHLPRAQMIECLRRSAGSSQPSR